MSQFFNKPAIKCLNKIGDIIAPKNGDFPSYSEYGCIEHVDDIVRYAPAEDIKDLNMVLSILSYMPKTILKWIVRQSAESHKDDGPLSVIFRQLDFGLKGIILSTYYSNKAGSGYKGKTPLEVIGYDIKRVGL